MHRSSDVSPSRLSFLTAFKPRQVILLEQQLKNPSGSAPMAKNEAGTPLVQLKPADEYTLICSVALWLDNKGFSKVLKRFLSAAEIPDDKWKAKGLNLNEIFSKYIETCHKVHEDSKTRKPEEQLVGSAEANGTCLASNEVEGKKKKKGKIHGNGIVIDNAETLEDTVKSNEKAQEDKTTRTAVDPSLEGGQSKASKGSDEDQSAKKQKDKKKKKDKIKSESDEKHIVVELTESNPKASLVKAADNGVDESKKVSKKRKKKDSDENETKPGQEVALKESKPKKPKVMEEGKGGQVIEEHEVENDQGTREGSHDFNDKQADDNTDAAHGNNGVNKSGSKSAKKQHKNSAEPKSVNVFQRVKIDEVQFADDRLQDNSYWAKDGADIGYGAKAQEVLGQVRGRDFRHEKTKKKRGSYRGGQIDLHSHSIKFNYSEEE